MGHYVASSVERTIRHYLGLTLVDMASFLRISAKQLAHAEAHRRALPGPALVRLERLIRLVPAELFADAPPSAPLEPSGPSLPPLPFPPLPLIPADPGSFEAAPLRARQRECAYRATMLRWELQKVQHRAASCQHRLAVLPVLQAELDAAPAPDERERCWLDWLASDTAYELGRCNPTLQLLMTLRIQALENEAAQLARALTGLA